MLPVVNAVPPVDAVYQFTVPALALAVSNRLPLTHAVAPALLLMVGIGFTVATTAVLSALVHDSAVASA